jgi:hypothetical protein
MLSYRTMVVTDANASADDICKAGGTSIGNVVRQTTLFPIWMLPIPR